MHEQEHSAIADWNCIVVDIAAVVVVVVVVVDVDVVVGGGGIVAAEGFATSSSAAAAFVALFGPLDAAGLLQPVADCSWCGE